MKYLKNFEYLKNYIKHLEKRDSRGVEMPTNIIEEFAYYVCKNDIEQVKKMIDDDVYIDTVCKNYHNRTPLGDAIMYEHYEIAKMLLDNGADPNGNGGDFPIFLCVFNTDFNLAKLLISYGADINCKEHNSTLLIKYCGRYFPGIESLDFFIKKANLSEEYNGCNFLQKILDNKKNQPDDILKYIKTVKFQKLLCEVDGKNVLLIPKKILQESIKKKYSIYFDAIKYNL